MRFVSIKCFYIYQWSNGMNGHIYFFQKIDGIGLPPKHVKPTFKRDDLFLGEASNPALSKKDGALVCPFEH